MGIKHSVRQSHAGHKLDDDSKNNSWRDQGAGGPKETERLHSSARGRCRFVPQRETMN
uniref:Uncharacterized protein n=1 Tax=Anguilla anguilla TaxID=7936 RepID=A0A0E9RSI0_ANGAN